MWRWKFLIFVTSLGSLILSGLAGYLEPLKRLVFSHADVRVFVGNDIINRRETISIRNAGANLADPVLIEIHSDKCVVKDFWCGRLHGGTVDSFLDTVAEVDPEELLSTTGLARERFQNLLDEHARERSLVSLQTLLAASLERHLSPHAGVASGMTKDEHSALLNQCKVEGSLSTGCAKEHLQEAAEKAIHNFQETVARQWRDVTGVVARITLYPPNVPKLTLQIPAPAHESRLLVIQYTDQVGNVNVTINAPKDRSTVVHDEDEVNRSVLWVLGRYHWRPMLLAGAIVLFSVLLAGTLFTSLEKQPAYQIINRALRSFAADEDAIWDVIFQKTRHLLTDEFNHFSAVFQKTKSVPARALFAYFRDRLRVTYALENTILHSRSDLDHQAREHMRTLASVA